MNVASLLANAAGKYPERTAVVSEEGRFSFRTLDRRTDALASAMLGEGFRKRERVGILFFNGIHFAEVYFASLKAGLVPTPVNFRFVGPEILHILNDSGASLFFFGPEFEETVRQIAGELESVRTFVSPKAGEPSFSRDYEDFLAGGEASPDLPEIHEDDWCQLMYTSGTTGKPKGALLTHRNILWNLVNTMMGREDREAETALIAGPLYHTAALNNHFTIQIALGGTSILMKKFEPVEYLKCIEREKVTVISGAPALFNLLLWQSEAGRYNRSSVTKCTAGADKLSAALKERLLDFFPNIDGVYDVYGCTEASPCIAILRAHESRIKHGSVGRALPFLRVLVVDEEGRPLPPGEVGELICKGPNVMEGYYGNPRATREALRDGWLYTGDLARQDEEGFFYIVDRKKDMILSGGENIYPRELEEVLSRHPAVADVAVVGVPDPQWGEAVKAYVVKREGTDLDEEEVVAFCKKYLAGYKKPRKVSFVDAIPRNPSGKALKRVLREQ